MDRNYKVISLALVVLVGIFIQVLLVFADVEDSPSKAAVKFARSYFAVDEAGLDAKLGDALKVENDINVVDEYVYRMRREANERGFKLGMYTRRKLYNVHTDTHMRGPDAAAIHLTAEVKSPMRSFFYEGDVEHIDVTIEVAQQDGAWKVVNHPFPLDDA